MQVFVADGAERHSVDIQDQSRIGSGGAGVIYQILDARYSGTVAKIYHQAAQCERTKIQAMLDAPPDGLLIRMNDRQVPVLSWPTHLLENDQGKAIGYLMPHVDISLAVPLNTYIEDIESLSEQDQSISLRIVVARNLTAALAALHEKRDYFIDLKPQNILVFKESGNICLLDCDGFAIDGGRFPAHQYSSQYMAPEILINRVEPQALSLNDYQDRFALAVIIFQILNYSTHPFQGILLDQSIEDANTDEILKRGWYAYGINPCQHISPVRTSIHEYWDTGTRQLFDRTFTAKRPSHRPSAVEWREHLDSLIQNKAFIKCNRFPSEVTHIHFKDKSCFVCEKFTVVTEPKPLPSPTPSPQRPNLLQKKQSSSVTSALKVIAKIAGGLIIAFVIVAGIAIIVSAIQ
jgi:DNA-binding helix-hairpin-helix protein with protein kinase domain